MSAAKNLTPQAMAELADLALSIAHNPDTRKQFAGLAKKVGAPFKFADVEAADSVLSEVDQRVKDGLAAEARSRAAAATTERLNTQRAKLVKSDANPAGRFTEEVIKTKLEPFMESRGIADYDDAVVLWNHSNPEPVPHPEIANAGFWQMPQGDILTDPKGWARKEAHKAVGDLHARRA